MTTNDKLNIRTRKFCLELYPDNQSHCKALEMLLNGCLYNNTRYVGILHDSDTFSETTPEHKEGEKKKKHYHFCIDLKDPKTRETIAKKLGIESRFIEPCEKWKGALMYLIHYNTEKYQYDTSDLIGDFDLIQYICETANKDNKAMQFYSIVNYIANVDGEIELAALYKACYKNGWFNALSKNQNLIINAVNQHNSKYVITKKSVKE